MGVLWQKPVVTVYVKPERYTWKFLEKGEYFTVSFLKGTRDCPYKEEFKNV